MSVSVQAAEFDVGAELQAVTAEVEDAGAVVTFTGVVRAGDPPIECMELEHYPGMTESALRKIETEATHRWPLLATRIVHRFGKLKPGEQIVLVITASAHRQAAFDAANFLMDYLKTQAPFWKKEYVAGDTRWVEARESDDHAAERWSETKTG